MCERAWRASRNERAATAGAHHALRIKDDAALNRWWRRALPTVEGARIIHFWGDRQRALGNLDGAEAALRRALALRINRDPVRATNTALALLALVKNHQPVDESIELARLAWEQAGRANVRISRAFAAEALVGMFVELGELVAAEAVLQRMDARDSHALRDLAEGRLRAAQGHHDLAVALFKRAVQPDAKDPWTLSVDAAIALVHALLDAGRIGDARAALDQALGLAGHKGTRSVDVECRLDAAHAAVQVAEHDLDGALATVERGLAKTSRDAAKVQLLNVRGDALALRRDFATAEQTWRAAADSVEAWRASIPTTGLRHGLAAHHRHALEAWLDSTASRGDVDGALEVIRRIAGRALLDRIRQREADARVATGAADASIEGVVRRLATDRELAATMDTMPDLRHATRDMVAIMAGQRAVWAIRRIGGRWSIDRVGDRAQIVDDVDAYRRAIDDPVAAEALGAAMFPADRMPPGGAPLAVLLDRELADVPLAGLRVGGKFLVEHAPILEVLAPSLLFAAVPTGAWDPPIALGDPAGDLPSAAGEVTAVARMLAIAPRTGPAASRAALAAGGHARVVHVATHSTVAAGGAALALADGALAALEIINQQIAPRLAVIATCRSQVDDNPATSLVAAFLAAGTAGVIGVKRTLDDRDGEALMRAFYAAGGADRPLLALAAAQRKAIAARRPPSAWAAVSFFGVGGWI